MKGVIDMVDEWTGKWKEEKGITRQSVENELYDFFNDKMETGDTPEIKRVGRYPEEYITTDSGIVIDCIGGRQIRLIIQVD